MGPSDEIPPNPSYVINEDNDTLLPSPKSNKLNILKIKNDIKLTLKSKDISLSNKGSKDDEIQMDSQKASDTSKSQSTSNSLDKDNEMNTSLITESAIINTEKGDIILSKTTKTSLQIESSIRNKEKPDITLSPSKNDQSNNPNPNEKNASINQSSSLKENTDVVSTSSEAAEKRIVSDPLLKSTNNSSQTKFASDPSDKIPPNPSFVPNPNLNPNPNEKNAVTNQSSNLKENTDVVSTSSETAKKVFFQILYSNLQIIHHKQNLHPILQTKFLPIHLVSLTLTSTVTLTLMRRML